MAYAGEVEAGLGAVAPFRTLAKPIVDNIGPMGYSEIFKLTEGGPRPVEEMARSFFIDAVDARTAEAIVEHFDASTAPPPTSHGGDRRGLRRRPTRR